MTSGSGMDDMTSDTIAAISTPPGIGGIGIVRISGMAAFGILHRLFRPADGRLWERMAADGLLALCSHQVLYGTIVDCRTQLPIDEALVLPMAAPRSYTREDVVEIQCHGGSAVLKRILESVLQAGARLAEPGEFTKRAFLNGRIDLTQAEAVLDLIEAQSEQAAAAALNILQGGLSKELTSLRLLVQDLSAELEACIDFPEDMPMPSLVHRMQWADRLASGILVIQKLLRAADGYARIRDGLIVTLLGKPNVGKSSLFNVLLGQERAIVTEIPGTTRDLIQAETRIHGVRLQLWDTAGIQETDDPVEHIGIQKTIEQCSRSDLILFMLDVRDAVPGPDDPVACAIAEKPHIVVLNKLDRVETFDPVPWEKRFHPAPVLAVSVKTGAFLDRLEEALERTIQGISPPLAVDTIVPNLRQKGLLLQLEQALRQAETQLRAGVTEEMVAEDLRLALHILQEISGESVRFDVLESVFSRFCIGK